MEFRVLSLEYISMVKIAVQTCVNPELKREILCVPGSYYNMNKACNQYDRKKQWNEIVEKKARLMLKCRGLPENLQDRVMSLIYAIGLRMLIWAEYHEGTIGFSREYSNNFLNGSHFTPQGIIDNKRVAEVMIKDDTLSIIQKLMLACIYCMKNKVESLFKQIMEYKTVILYGNPLYKASREAGLVSYWYYRMIDEFNKSPLLVYEFSEAIKSGSVAAIEYFWVKSSRCRRVALMYAAEEVLKSREESVLDDWIVFRDRRYDFNEEWVPNDYLVDIFCYLLSNMTEEQQMLILNRDTEGVYYQTDKNKNNRSRVLELFLRWPYQDYFMKVAAMMWSFLPKITYATLLLKICDEIEPRKENNLSYGEEKSFDYRRLLKEFWCQSPRSYKKFVLNNQKVTYMTDTEVKTKTGVGLLIKLLSLKEFTYRDEKILQLILDSADVGQIKNIISSKEWEKVCIGLIKEEKWGLLDRFAPSNFLTKDESCKIRKLSFTEAKRICIYFAKFGKWNAVETFIKWISLPEDYINELKKEVIYSKDGKDECLKLLSCNRMKSFDKFIRWCLPCETEVAALKRNLAHEVNGRCQHVHLTEEYVMELVDIYIAEFGKWNAAETFMEWISSSENDTNELKGDTYSKDGKDECLKPLSSNRMKKFDKFIRWCHPCKTEAVPLKNFAYELNGRCQHIHVTEEYVVALVDNFTKSNHPTKKKIKQFKKSLAYVFGSSICEELISDYSVDVVYDREGNDVIHTRIEFRGGKWEKVNDFLSWCFSSMREIKVFKKNKLLKTAGVKIHFKLIKTKQWKEAEFFFTWLGLNAEEIKDLKRRTLFHNREALSMFRNLVFRKDWGTLSCSCKEDEINKLLMWYLTDEETVLEFRDLFKRDHKNFDKADLNNFDAMIERHITFLTKVVWERCFIVLDPEHNGVKRRLDTCSPKKKLCSLKLEEREEQNAGSVSLNKTSEVSEATK